MNKPLARRAFLKVMGAAPVAAQQLAGKVAALEATDTMRAIGMGIGDSGSLGGPMPHGLWQIINNKKLLALHRMGMLPDWAREDVEREVRREASYYIPPNLMALKSVSFAAKRHIRSTQAVAEAWTNVEKQAAMHMARRAFFDLDGRTESAGQKL